MTECRLNFPELSEEAMAKLEGLHKKYAKRMISPDEIMSEMAGLEHAEVLKALNESKNYVVRGENLARVMNNDYRVGFDSFWSEKGWKESKKFDPVEGIKNLFDYTTNNVKDKYNTIDNAIRAHAQAMYHSFSRAFEGKLGLLKRAEDGRYDLDVYEHIYDNKELTGEALAYAEAIKKSNAVQFEVKQQALMHVQALKKYVRTTVHDFEKILAVPKEEWVAHIKEAVDWERSFNTTDDTIVTEFLGDTYDRIEKGDKQAMNGLSLGSGERVYHFKTGKDAYDYNMKFGDAQTLYLSQLNSIDRLAKKAGLIKIFGNKPEENLETLFKDMHSLGQVIPAGDKHEIRGLMNYFMGNGETPGYRESSASTWKRRVNNYMALAQLGKASLSIVLDWPSMAMKIHNINGGSFIGSMVDLMGSFIKNSSPEDVAKLGVMMESEQMMIRNRLLMEGKQGMSDRMVGVLAKTTGLDYMIGRSKRAGMSAVRHELATFVDTIMKGKSLNNFQQNFLKASGLSEAEWRQVAGIMDKGGKVDFMPGGRDFNLFLVDNAIRDAETAAEKVALTKLRQKLGLTVAEYSKASPMATPRTRAAWQMLDNSTKVGTAAEFFLKYKGPVAQIWVGAKESLRSSNLEGRLFANESLKHLAKLSGSMMIVGAGTQMLKDATRIPSIMMETPQGEKLADRYDYTNDKFATNMGLLAIDSLTSSGILGVPGDIIGGGALSNRTLSERFGGAAIGEVSSGVETVKGLLADAMTVASEQSFSGVKIEKYVGQGRRMMPFNNAFYVQSFYDYLQMQLTEAAKGM